MFEIRKTLAGVQTTLYTVCLTVGLGQVGTTQQNRVSKLGADAAFYDPAVVQDIELEVAAAELERLHTALPERIYAHATFRWGEQVLKNVGLRYKGNSSSRPNQAHKRGFVIKFSEFDAQQRFLGLRRIGLDNGVQFGSLFSERIITDILREVGVRCCRCNYARVKLNGKYMGVYVNVERVDQGFLKRNFPGTKGVLYKNHVGGPGGDFKYQGDDPKIYQRAFELKEGKKRVRPTDLVAFLKGIDGRDKSFDLAASFDIDSFLWQTAVLLLSGAFDQYTGWGPHNYYLFHSHGPNGKQPGRWHYLTWDLDVGFAAQAFGGRVAVLRGWNAAWPAPSRARPLMERILADPKLLATYRQRARQLLNQQFTPKKMHARIDTLYGQIKDDLQRDPFPKGRATNPEDSSYQEVIESMKRFMIDRHRLALTQLEDPGERPEFAQRASRERRGRGRGPQPGKSSADAPSHLAIVKSSPKGVELQWRDNAKGEHGVIIQRCSGAPKGPFHNLKLCKGPNRIRGFDDSVRPGATYRYRVYAVRPSRTGPLGSGVSNVVTVKIETP